MNCLLAQGSWLKKKILSQSLEDKGFLPYCTAKPCLNKHWKYNPHFLAEQQPQTQEERFQSSSGLCLTSPLCLSFTQPNVFYKAFRDHRQEKVYKETDTTIITQCYGSVLCEGIDSHNEHPKSERWEDMWEQKRRKLDYDSDREKSSRWQGFRDLGKHSDISMMVSVKKIVKNMTRRKSRIRKSQPKLFYFVKYFKPPFPSCFWKLSCTAWWGLNNREL